MTCTFVSNGKKMTKLAHKTSTLVVAWDTPLQMIDQIRTGLPKSEADETAVRLALSQRDIARILNISERSYHRYQADTRLDAVATERLLHLRKLYQLGEEVFEDMYKFGRWMKRPLRVLGNKAPIELVDTATGMRLVEDELFRIEHNVYA
jgi:putative toxin-antitoxin system antitoxin component (TIGR02293 family)